jgi:hypothetical protein
LKVDKILKIYKEGVEANSIEVLRLENCEFNVVVGKGLHKVGDKIIYVMPDYSIPNSEIFKEYISPGNDPKKCKLGKKNRVRAIKFNFQLFGMSDPIYSNGIAIPESIFNELYLNVDKENTDLQALLQVVKYEAEENIEGGVSGLTKGDLPSFLYATDESRIETLKSHVNRVFEEGEVIGGSIKVDGSSTTLYDKKDIVNPENILIGICSRNMEKKIDQQVVSWFKEKVGETEYILHPYVNPENKEKGWYNDFTQKFYTQAEVESNGFEAVITEIRDSFVDCVKDHGYLDKFVEYCKKYNVELALRGELLGRGGSKGSGKSVNQDVLGERRIKWFGVDDLSSGHATRIHYGQEHNLKKISDELGWEYTQTIFEEVLSYDEIISKCDAIFKKIKEETGQIIEGIVLRTMYSNKLSCKYLNPEYDAKK